MNEKRVEILSARVSESLADRVEQIVKRKEIPVSQWLQTLIIREVLDEERQHCPMDTGALHSSM